MVCTLYKPTVSSFIEHGFNKLLCFILVLFSKKILNILKPDPCFFFHILTNTNPEHAFIFYTNSYVLVQVFYCVDDPMFL